MSLTAAIFAAMAAGSVLGVAAPGFAVQLAPLAEIFLRLVKSLIAPLLLGALVVGVAGTAGASLGRIGLKALLYFQVVTIVALSLGLAAGNLFQPGVGLDVRAVAAAEPVAALSWQAVIENAAPSSILDAMARGEMLQIVVFAGLLGMACAAAGEKARPLVEFCSALAEVMFRYTNYLMYLAPLGVGAAMAATVGAKGIGVFVNFGRLIAAEYAALLVLIAAYFALMAAAGIPIRRFLSAIREPFAIAFATTASGAALPRALEKMAEFGVPRGVLNFVMPLGFCFNTAGTALHIALSCLFLSQAVGVRLGVSQQLTMLAIWMVTTKGVAAVPRTSLVVIIGTLTQFGVPLDALPVLLGVDIVLDMLRTATNLIGNCLAPALVARWEGSRLSPAG